MFGLCVKCENGFESTSTLFGRVWRASVESLRVKRGGMSIGFLYCDGWDRWVDSWTDSQVVGGLLHS